MADPAKVLFRNASYDGQLMRTLAAALSGRADLGEALATARRIGKPSGTAWYDAWSRTAGQTRQTAEKARASGERVSARHGFLRASEYYRQAFYYLRSDLDDRRLQDAYRAHVDTFRAATALMDHTAEAVRIPHDTTTVNGYLFAPNGAGEARPTLTEHQGLMAIAEVSARRSGRRSSTTGFETPFCMTRRQRPARRKNMTTEYPPRWMDGQRV